MLTGLAFYALWLWRPWATERSAYWPPAVWDMTYAVGTGAMFYVLTGGQLHAQHSGRAATVWLGTVLKLLAIAALMLLASVLEGRL